MKDNIIKLPADTPFNVTKHMFEELAEKYGILEISFFQRNENVCMLIEEEITEEKLNEIKIFVMEQLRFYMFHFN